jgi:hypothetical protein
LITNYTSDARLNGTIASAVSCEEKGQLLLNQVPPVTLRKGAAHLSVVGVSVVGVPKEEL